MKKGLLAFLIFTLFIFTSVSLMFFAWRVEASKGGSNSTKLPVHGQVLAKNIITSPIDRYYASSQDRGSTLTSLGKSDSRPVIVDNFLSKNNSPMRGLGNIFVKVADLYKIDYRLLPAIAFQESTLGKRIPRNSHNAFGWAIYTGANSGAKFNDWQHAIEVVAQGLKTDYIDRGLNTPEAIMTRYTDSDGAWAFGVNFAIEEMTPR